MAGDKDMAYCKKCGAYMPDNFDRCLACGFSEGAAQAQAKAEAERAAAEEKRRAQQQEAERWAKEEKQRRESNTSEDGWTRVNYGSSSRSNGSRQNTDYYINKVKQAGNTAGEYFYKAEEKMKSAGIDKSKALAALSYISFLWVLPYIFCSGDEFAGFHAKQGLILFICNFVLDILSIAAPIMWALKVVSFLLMLVGIKNALTGEKKRLPFIGNILK